MNPALRKRGLTLSQVFKCQQFKSFENIKVKGDIALNDQFLLFPQCFLPKLRSFCHLHQIQEAKICCLGRLDPLPDDKILDWSKLKQIADNILKCI